MSFWTPTPSGSVGRAWVCVFSRRLTLFEGRCPPYLRISLLQPGEASGAAAVSGPASICRMLSFFECRRSYAEISALLLSSTASTSFFQSAFSTCPRRGSAISNSFSFLRCSHSWKPRHLNWHPPPFGYNHNCPKDGIHLIPIRRM